MTWVRFTRRTNDPKLAWLQAQLAQAGIPSRRNGESWHAPILEVPEDKLDAAWAILDPVDDIPDDNFMFSDYLTPDLDDPEEPGAVSESEWDWNERNQRYRP